MKYLIISDIHGSLKFINKAIKAFDDFHCDNIILLGDILYHGPRNDLPEEYNPKGVISILNEYKDKIIAIAGNCDAEVDQMVLEFNINQDMYVNLNGIKFYLCHGHHLDKVPHDAKKVLYGHTHIHKIETVDDKLFINPGSISIPKGDKINSFMILNENIITLYDFSYNKLDSINL